MSAAQHPKGGAVLSPSACGFVGPEIDKIVDRYNRELNDPDLSITLRGMTQHHLEGLLYIQKLINEGFSDRP